jgi:hypothetical protein
VTFFDKLQWSYWLNASPSERKEILQGFADYISADLGIPQQINLEEKTYYDARTLGNHNRENEVEIGIKSKLISSNVRGDNFLAMETIMHELRHVYQDIAVNDIEQLTIDKRPTNIQIELWRENQNYYFEPSIDELKYYIQSTEHDTRKYSYDKMCELEEHFRTGDEFDKEDYENFVISQYENEQRIVDSAVNNYGLGFEKKIAREIALESNKIALQRENIAAESAISTQEKNEVTNQKGYPLEQSQKTQPSKQTPPQIIDKEFAPKKDYSPNRDFRDR